MCAVLCCATSVLCSILVFTRHPCVFGISSTFTPSLLYIHLNLLHSQLSPPCLHAQTVISIMAMRPSLITKGMGLGGAGDTGSPAEQRDDAKKNMLKAMRPLPTQHYWNIFFDRYVSVLSLVLELGTRDNIWTAANRSQDSKRNNQKPQMAHTQLPLNKSEHQLHPYRISGRYATICQSIRSRCASPYTCSSKDFNQFGKIEGTSMVGVGHLECPSSMDQISGLECS